MFRKSQQRQNRNQGQSAIRAAVGAAIESLESRRMLAVNYVGGAADRLELTGGGGNDVYVVDDFPTFVRVQENGMVWNLNKATRPIGLIVATLAGGHDSLTVESTMAVPVHANGGPGNDTVFTGAKDDFVIGDIGNDLVYTADGNDYVDSGDGHDVVHGEVGFDTIAGGIGFDSLFGEEDDDDIDGGDEADYVEGGTGKDTILGRLGNDSLFGQSEADYIEGGEDSDDYIEGGTENDTLSGQSGNDTILGDQGEDVIDGGFDADSLVGGTENDEIDGGDYRDTLEGGDGRDTLRGGDGVDDLSGDADNDELYGGLAGDTLDGGPDNDSLHGEEGADNLIGGDDDDDLFGDSGNDTLEGEGGEDLLQGDTEDDSLRGGEGNDTLRGADGNDELHGDGGNDELTGADGNDSLFGESGDDRLDAGLGDDELEGMDGHDSLYGGDGFDNLEGGTGRDGLFGGADLIEDTVTGGADEDRFLNMYTGGSAVGQNWEDNITDKANEDARIGFKDGNQIQYHTGAQNGDYTYAAGIWTNAEIETVDTSLAVLHHATFNKELLEQQHGNEIEFLRHGALIAFSGDFRPAAWNDGGQIHVVDDAFDEIGTPPTELFVHEIGHYWDEEYDKNGWEALSGWERTPADTTGMTQGTDASGDWWYDTGELFVSSYAQTNPDEDFADSFAAYFLDRAGLTFAGDDSGVSINSIADKKGFFDDMVADLA